MATTEVPTGLYNRTVAQGAGLHETTKSVAFNVPTIDLKALELGKILKKGGYEEVRDGWLKSSNGSGRIQVAIKTSLGETHVGALMYEARVYSATHTLSAVSEDAVICQQHMVILVSSWNLLIMTYRQSSKITFRSPHGTMT